MNCNVARDLLAGYNDNVLEEETKKELEDHLEQCENCKQLSENFSVDLSEKESKANKDEIKPFKKVKKKLIHRKITVIILSIILLAIIGGLGYLTVGQIVKEYDMYSFELIAEDIKARQIANYLKDGKINEFLNCINFGDFKASTGLYSIKNIDSYKAKEAIKNRLTNAYNKEIKGKSFKIEDVRSYYDETGAHFFSNKEGKTTLSFVNILIDGKEAHLAMTREADGCYSININDECYNTDNCPIKEMDKTLMSFNDMVWLANEEYQTGDKMLMAIPLLSDDHQFPSRKLAKEYEKFKEDKTSIKVSNDGICFDDNSNRFYVDITIVITDGENDKKAIYETRCYLFNEKNNGIDEKYENIYNNGVREEKITQLKNLLNYKK